jgi:hypothetical protein
METVGFFGRLLPVTTVTNSHHGFQEDLEPTADLGQNNLPAHFISNISLYCDKLGFNRGKVSGFSVQVSDFTRHLSFC